MNLGKYISSVNGIFTLAAFIVAAILAVTNIRNGKASNFRWYAVGAMIVIGIIPMVIWFRLESQKQSHVLDRVYRVRVTVLRPNKLPIEDPNGVRLWSTYGGEKKVVDGGLEFDIPEGTRPRDGALDVYAEEANAFLAGHATVVLKDEYNPPLTIELVAQLGAVLKGLVTDEKRRAIRGARVFIVGFPSEAVTTKEDGAFELNAHAANGQEVQVRVEASGYNPAWEWETAGATPISIQLDKTLKR